MTPQPVTCPRCPACSWAVSAQDAADWLAMHNRKNLAEHERLRQEQERTKR